MLPVVEFYKNKSKKDGLDSLCKECNKSNAKKWRELNYEKSLETSRKWKRDNYERHLANSAKWAKENREHCNDLSNKWAKNNPEKIKKIQQKFRKNNPDKIRVWTRKTSAKLRSTPSGKLKRNMGTAICLCLQGKKGGKHWEELVGYTLDDLKAHLEKLFKPGMSWENYGMNGWEVDHKYPIALFDFNNPGEIKKCWSLDNLQPLWRLENISKGKKLIYHPKEYLVIPAQEVANG